MKIAYLIADKNFRDEEYFMPREILEDNDFQVITFSSEGGVAFGSEGGEVNALSVEKLIVDDFDALLVAGGGGALKYLDNENIYSLLKEFNESQKLIGAICIAPAILAKSGIIKNKKATIWSSDMDKSAIKILDKNNVRYFNGSVVCDQNIITANGPMASEEFGEKIVEKLLLDDLS